MAITRVENDHTRKKFTLVLKTTYKNVFLKYQVNARFLSLCFVSENFHRRKKEEKKKSRQPIGDPVRGRYAPMMSYMDKGMYLQKLKICKPYYSKWKAATVVLAINNIPYISLNVSTNITNSWAWL